jgi:hypothetical protein
MTTKAVTTTDVALTNDGSVKLLTWASMANGDDGTPMASPEYADLCVQVSGTFGAGGTILWEGSNDNSTWATLNNVQGTALSLTAAAIKQIAERPLWIRPRVSGGDGTTALIASCLARRSNPLRT